MDLQNLFALQERLLFKTSLQNKRYLLERINFEHKLIGILGQRGVGKTTLMLQYLKEHFHEKTTALYISLDMPYFANISLFEFAREFEQNGGEYLFVDEVHKYDNWAAEFKNIYDFLNIKVIFSGSSLLQIAQDDGDISRRAVIYHLENLSFREYLKLNDLLDYRALTLEEILSNHTDIAKDIVVKIKIIKYFKEYLRFGAYPFVLEGRDDYHLKLIQIINQILEGDLPYVTNIDFAQIKKIKKMFFMISTLVPFVPNISELARMTHISRPKVYDYLELLERAKLINAITSREKGYNILKKPEKLYLQNTNINFALANTPDIGTIRESFFVNQIKNTDTNRFLGEKIYTSKKGDFLVEDRYVFEIGGKNKGFDQIKGIKNSFVAADDIEIGFKNKIPLWLFGFLY